MFGRSPVVRAWERLAARTLTEDPREQPTGTSGERWTVRWDRMVTTFFRREIKVQRGIMLNLLVGSVAAGKALRQDCEEARSKLAAEAGAAPRPEPQRRSPSASWRRLVNTLSLRVLEGSASGLAWC